MVENSLVLNSNHNGINCIQKTDAERPCDKIWFTAKQIQEWSERLALYFLAQIKTILQGTWFSY